MSRGVATIKFRSSVNRSRDTSGHSIINGYRILRELGSGTESSVRLGQSVHTGMQVSIYFQPLTNSRKGFNRYAGRFNYFQLLDKINLYAIPGTRRVLEIWYNKTSCEQLHHMLVNAGVTFIDDPNDTTAFPDDSDSTIAKTLFLLVEYCNNGGIYSIVGQLYYSEYIFFSRRLSYTIYRLHKAGIVHKDIKIDNILFSKKSLTHNELFYAGSSASNIDPYLIDFGISIDLDLLDTKIITIDTMLERIGQMLLHDLGQITISEWFDTKGPVYSILSHNNHLDKIIKILVYYIKYFFTIETVRILADPLISSDEKFITNKTGTVVYLPPEIRWESLLDSICDRLVPTTKEYNPTSHNFTDTFTLIRGSSNNYHNSFESNRDIEECASCHTNENSDSQRSNCTDHHMTHQVTIVKSTISCSKARQANKGAFKAAFKEISICNSFYAILPSPIDVWCFGVTVLYIMIGAARMEPLYRRSNDVLAISQHLTPFTTDLLCGCLALDPIERYTAEDISRHPIYIGYRVSYEESNLTTYISSVEEYRNLFDLPSCCEEGIISEIKSAVEDDLEQTSGNALENYHQYIMRRRRKTIISNNRKHIRRASLSSLESVSHEHIFKEVYSDDIILTSLKLHNSDLFADPWISPVLLQLDLAAISLQVRNSTVHYLHPPDFPDNRSYLVPKFFDVAYTLSKSQTLSQGLFSMKLKYLNYLATRLLGTTVYHNSLTDFKKHIMPEHIRGYTPYGDLVPWVANASASGWEWSRYRRCWGTKTLQRGNPFNESLLFSPEYLSTLILSSPEMSSSSLNSDDYKSILDIDLQEKRHSTVAAIKRPCHNLAASKLRSVPTDMAAFDMQSSSPVETLYEDNIENEVSSSQYRITEEGTTATQQMITYTDATTTVVSETNETHETSYDMFPLGLTTPSEHHTIDMKIFSSQIIQPPSCELLVHKSQFLDTALVSHEVVAGHHSIDNPLGQFKGCHPKSSNLICPTKITTAKSFYPNRHDSTSHTLTKDTLDQHTIAASEHIESQRNSLLSVSTTRALALHRSYATKHPIHDNDHTLINSTMIHGEKPRDLQVQKNIQKCLNNSEFKSVQSTSGSASLNINIGCSENELSQRPDIMQIDNISMQSVSESIERNNTASKQIYSNIFNSQTILPCLKDILTTETQTCPLIELPSSSFCKLSTLPKNQLTSKRTAIDNQKAIVPGPQQATKPLLSGGVSITRTIRNQLRSVIGDKVTNAIDAYGRLTSAVAPVTVKNVQFHCQRRYALFKKSLPKKYNPPLKTFIESQTPSSDQYEQDGSQSLCPHCSASASSSIIAFKHANNTALSLQTSDSTTINTDVRSLKARIQDKVSSALKQSMLISSLNCETTDIATLTVLCSEIDTCQVESGIERNSTAHTLSDINVSPFETLLGAHISNFVHTTIHQEQNVKNTSLKAPSVLSHTHGFSEMYGEESADTDPSITSLEEARLFNQSKNISQCTSSHITQTQSTTANVSDALSGVSSIPFTGIPLASSSQTNSCQHTKSITLVDFQRSSRLRCGGDVPDAASDSNNDDHVNKSNVIMPAEVITTPTCLSVQCTHKNFINVLKRRSRNYSLARMLLNELEAQHPVKSQLLLPKRLDTSIKTSQETTFEDISESTSQSSNSIVLPHCLFRSRTFNALIDLSDIESFDGNGPSKEVSTQNNAQDNKKHSHKLQGNNPILLKRKNPSLSENVFKAKWHYKNNTPISTLPLVSTRNLGAIERIFMEEGAGSLDSSKLTRISRYNANNTNMKRAALYLRNSCTSNITVQDTDRIRAITHDISDTNNDDDRSSDKMATSARLCHFSSGQLDELDENYKHVSDNFPSSSSKVVESNLCSHRDTPINVIGKCAPLEEKVIEGGGSVIHIIESERSVIPTDPYNNMSPTLVGITLSSGNAPLIGDEGIPFINQRVVHNLEASTASYIARDSVNTAATCLTIIEDNEKTFSKSDDVYTPTKEMERRHTPLVLSSKIDQGDTEKTFAQLHTISMIDSQVMTEARWRASSRNLRRAGDMITNLSTAVDNPLAKYAEGMPRFLNRFFPFSFTQSLFSSATRAPYQLSGLFFSHYYTYMLPYTADALDMFVKHDLMDISREYELSISLESAQEAVCTSAINNPAPKAMVGSCRTMSNNKVLRPAEVVSKKPPVRTLSNLKLTDFSELFNDISADEETHILELETKDSQYEGSEFLMEDCSFEI